MKRYCIWGIVCGLVLGALSSSCGPESGKEETPSSPEVTGNLIVTVEGAGLHSDPGPEAHQVATLSAGTSLQDLQEVSPFTTPVVLGGEAMDLPWLKVRLASGQEGWVYAGMVGLVAADPLATASLRQEKTLAAIFGPETPATIGVFADSMEMVREAAATAAAYRQGIALRDLLVTRLDQHLEHREGELPDLFWLEQVIPGFIPQLAAEGTTYYLFADYRQWLQLANGTSDQADDDFFSLCVNVFPEDSVEYFFPAWTIQTWDYGGHSLLGQGIHRRLLRQMELVNNRSRLFAPEIERFKTDVVNDIVRPHITYWEPQEKIVGELELIISDSLRLLTAQEQTAIRTRLEQFRASEAYGIKLNQRAGE